ncbi:hypothetical protein ABK040_006215 [Willaertia magna]
MSEHQNNLFRTESITKILHTIIKFLFKKKKLFLIIIFSLLFILTIILYLPLFLKALNLNESQYLFNIYNKDNFYNENYNKSLNIPPLVITHKSRKDLNSSLFHFYELNFISIQKDGEFKYLNRKKEFILPVITKDWPPENLIYFNIKKMSRIHFSGILQKEWPSLQNNCYSNLQQLNNLQNNLQQLNNINCYHVGLYNPIVLDFSNMWHSVLDHLIFIYHTLQHYYNNNTTNINNPKIALLFHTNKCCSWFKYKCDTRESCLNENLYEAVQLVFALAKGKENIYWLDKEYIKEDFKEDFTKDFTKTVINKEVYIDKLFIGMNTSCRSIGGLGQPETSLQKRECINIYFNMASYFLKYFKIIKNDKERILNKSEKIYKIIYLSRKSANNKYIVNETQILKKLKQNLPKNTKLKIVQFEKMKIKKQLKTIHKATLFISGRGAGMTNSIYLRRGAGYIHVGPKMLPFSSFSELNSGGVDWFYYQTVNITEKVCYNYDSDNNVVADNKIDGKMDDKSVKMKECEKKDENWTNWKVNEVEFVNTVLFVLNRVINNLRD